MVIHRSVKLIWTCKKKNTTNNNANKNKADNKVYMENASEHQELEILVT